MIELPKNPFGGVDEQAATNMFEELCGGVARATQLLRIWERCHSTGMKGNRYYLYRRNTVEDDIIICKKCNTETKEYGYCEVNGDPYGECCWGEHIESCEKCKELNTQ